MIFAHGNSPSTTQPAVNWEDHGRALRPGGAALQTPELVQPGARPIVQGKKALYYDETEYLTD
ncbi:hypothetical protein GCM10007884_49730 [Methylobacterium brachythecii]|uniref:Uncharacterized protein n=1 Tax=Methylobacterium brachythecii TaxID=1176177 RepID=A0ABQ6DFA9_9HYPH|nr:hypothetical protein GCM10007884_49730 [Methylobacterium brachythecii]